MGTRAGRGSPRVATRNQRLPPRQASPATPSRLSTPALALQQSQVPGELLVEDVVLLHELAVRLAVQIADSGALLLHRLREGGVPGRLGPGPLQLRHHVV